MAQIIDFRAGEIPSMTNAMAELNMANPDWSKVAFWGGPAAQQIYDRYMAQKYSDMASQRQSQTALDVAKLNSGAKFDEARLDALSKLGLMPLEWAKLGNARDIAEMKKQWDLMEMFQKGQNQKEAAKIAAEGHIQGAQLQAGARVKAAEVGAQKPPKVEGPDQMWIMSKANEIMQQSGGKVPYHDAALQARREYEITRSDQKVENRNRLQQAPPASPAPPATQQKTSALDSIPLSPASFIQQAMVGGTPNAASQSDIPDWYMNNMPEDYQGPRTMGANPMQRYVSPAAKEAQAEVLRQVSREEASKMAPEQVRQFAAARPEAKFKPGTISDWKQAATPPIEQPMDITNPLTMGGAAPMDETTASILSWFLGPHGPEYIPKGGEAKAINFMREGGYPWPSTGDIAKMAMPGPSNITRPIQQSLLSRLFPRNMPKAGPGTIEGPMWADAMQGQKWADAVLSSKPTLARSGAGIPTRPQFQPPTAGPGTLEGTAWADNMVGPRWADAVMSTEPTLARSGLGYPGKALQQRSVQAPPFTVAKQTGNIWAMGPQKAKQGIQFSKTGISVEEALRDYLRSVYGL